MKCGYLQLTRGEFLQEAHPYYAEPKALIFMKRFDWDAEHDIHILKYQYGTDFSLAPEKGDRIRRYIPADNPEISVRIYYYDFEEITDDYKEKMLSKAFLDCSREHHMHREYVWGRFREGDISFVFHNRDDLESFSKDMALMIKEAMKKPFFEKNVGWLNIKLDNGNTKTSYFGDYIPFNQQNKPKDYYSDYKNIMNDFYEDP